MPTTTPSGRTSGTGRRPRRPAWMAARTCNARTSTRGPRHGRRSRADPDPRAFTTPPGRSALGRRSSRRRRPMTTTAPSAESPGVPSSARRRLAAALHRRPRLRLGLLLAGPGGWLFLAYLGSLAILFLNAGWSRDAFTGLVKRDWTLNNFAELVTNPLYRTVTLRTIGMAVAVTVTCALAAFPIAYYMARVASPRVRGLLVVAVLMPLWSSYLIKAYSWRLILAEDGVMNWFLAPLGLKGPGYGEVGLWLVFVYLWLPYMIL